MSDEARLPKRGNAEAEAVAIEADPAVKPAPVPARAPEIGSPEWLRKVQQDREDQEEWREAATVYQLSLWPDHKRAMPTDFLVCALFAAIQEKDASYFNGVQIANANGFEITFRGKRLTQVHADVWQGKKERRTFTAGRGPPR
jgi:hypothetical protein